MIRAARDAQADRIVRYLLPDQKPSPTVLLALEGWMNFNNAVMFDWLDSRMIERDKLLDLMTGSLAGILVTAFRVDRTHVSSAVLEELEAELAASA